MTVTARRSPSLTVCAAFAFASCQLAATAFAQTVSAPANRFQITDLGTLGTDPAAGSRANAINDAGLVVGAATLDSRTTHAFSWAQGQITDLDPSGASSYSEADAVNNSGQIAGISVNPVTSFAEVVRWTNGQMEHLGTPATPGSLPLVSQGLGIGPSGRVLGRLEQVDVDEGQATAWDVPGGALDFGLGNATRVTGINTSGQIVGSGFAGGAFVWQSGVTTFLPMLSTDDGGAVANAINMAGDVVGAAFAADGSRHAVLWPHMGGIVDLGVLGNLAHAEARDINAANQVVGTADDAACVACGRSRAFLWESGGAGLVDLNTLIPSNSGWVLTQANGINSQTQIVGAGLHNGTLHAYLLSPSHP